MKNLDVITELYNGPAERAMKAAQAIFTSRMLYQHMLPSILELVPEHSVWVDGDGDIMISLTLNSKQDIAPVVRSFIKLGLRVRGSRSATSSNTTWSFTFIPRERTDEEDQYSIPTIHLMITPRSCRRVKVGEETRVIEIFETVCD